MKVLIVEDDRNYRALLFRAVYSWGHDMLAVSDALHAVALLDEGKNGIDLVILDLNLPRLGGVEIMATYAYWTKCRARFILMSGSEIPEASAGHPKVVGSLRKPATLEAIKQLIDAADEMVHAARRRIA